MVALLTSYSDSQDDDNPYLVPEGYRAAESEAFDGAVEAKAWPM